jgi:hypothetical protein
MFKYKCRISCVIAAGIAPMIFGGQVASAGLLSSVNYNQVAIAYDGPSTGASPVIQYLSGTTLPLSTTLTATQADGCSSTANYSFTDTGTEATFNVSCTGVLTAGGQGASEGSQGPIYTSFVLSGPSSYTATLTSALTAGTESGSYMELSASNSSVVFSRSGDNDTSLSSSGTLSAGVTYTFIESWGMGNTQFGDVATGHGSHSMTLTLTAVPEPSSVCLLTLAGATFLTCRRKRFYV